MSEVVRCSRCSKTTRIVLTRGERRTAIDPDPHPSGVVVIEPADSLGRVRARILTGSELPALVTAYRLHEKTCPRGRHAGSHLPRCGVCREVMDPWLPANGFTAHIGCLPILPPRRTTP